MKTSWKLLYLLACGAGAACSPSQNAPSAGSQTHFLATCDTGCPAPYSCICGACTLHCADDSQCQGVAKAAACQPPTAASATQCAAEPTCDVTCSVDADCRGLGTGYGCTAKRCRSVATVISPHQDAGAMTSRDSGNAADSDAGASTGTGQVSRDAAADAARSLPDGAVLGVCNQDADCVFRAGDGCCGSCLAPSDPVTKSTAVCVVACTGPPGGCSCVNHRCTRGVLTVGEACDPTQDACGSGLGCCPTCVHGPGDSGPCGGPTCVRLASFNPKSCPPP